MAASVLNLLRYVVLVKVCEETLTLYTFFWKQESLNSHFRRLWMFFLDTTSKLNLGHFLKA